MYSCCTPAPTSAYAAASATPVRHAPNDKAPTTGTRRALGATTRETGGRKRNEEPKPDYQNVAFFSPTMPAGFDERNPGNTVLQMACEKFGFSPDDFNPSHGGRFYGERKFGFTFEVQVNGRWRRHLREKAIPACCIYSHEVKQPEGPTRDRVRLDKFSTLYSPFFL